jgi:methylase of polypeptide subunit release factors
VDVVAQLGELLRAAGFARERQAALARMPGGVPPAAVLAGANRPEDARLSTLVALFQQDRTVAAAAAAEALAPLTVDDLIDAGLIEAVGSGVRARMKLLGFDDLLIAGDPIDESEKRQYVVAVSPASVRVACVTVRRQIETALDLGTGSGIQALMAARHADRVVGVDVNEHALSCARLSQRLSGLDNITWVQGDWLEPVRGQRFDLVVVNPSVIVTPENAVFWRDSAVGAKALSRRLVREAADHLNEGAFATVLCHWPHRDGDWEHDPREWVAGLGCDALLLHFASEEPLAYAMKNAVHRPDHDPAQLAETVTRWARYYRETGVEQITAGAVILRLRSGGGNWTRSFHFHGGSSSPAGDQIERMFAAADFLAAHAGAEQLRVLLATNWRLVEGHRLDQTLIHENGAYATSSAVMGEQPGPKLDAPLDARVVPILIGCDGRRSLGEVLSQTPVPDGLDRPGLHSLALSTVRDLIARGFLVAS